MKNKPVFLIPLLISVTGIIALTLLLGKSAYREGKRIEEIPVMTADSNDPDTIHFYAAEYQIVSMDTAPTPTPGPQADQPNTAVDLIVRDKAVLSVQDRNTADALLTAWLDAADLTPEGEWYLSSAFTYPVSILPAAGAAPYCSFDQALGMLKEDPALIPVTVKTISITAEEDPAAGTSKNSAVWQFKGERKITQLGSIGRIVYTCVRTYVGGNLSSEGEKTPSTVIAGRSTLLTTGKYTEGREKIRPGTGNFTISSPLKGKPVSSFGITEGVFNGGIEYEASADSPVYVPADGIVLYCSERGSYGFTVDIDHGNGFISRLSHLKDTDLVLNQRLHAGDMFARLDGTDFDPSVTPRLRYELFFEGARVDPELYIG